MRDGSFVLNPTPWPLNPSSDNAGLTLHAIALRWLSSDRALRIQEEKEGKRAKTRGPRTNVSWFFCFVVHEYRSPLAIVILCFIHTPFISLYTCTDPSFHSCVLTGYTFFCFLSRGRPHRTMSIGSHSIKSMCHLDIST